MRIGDRDAPLEAVVATTAVAGEHFRTVQGGHPPALHPTRIEGFIALQPAVDSHQHLLQRFQGKARQAVTQHVVTEGARGSDRLLQGRFPQLGFQRLEAAQAEQESVEGRQEYRAGGEVGVLARVAQSGEVAAKIEDLMNVAGEGGEPVVGDILHSIKCKKKRTRERLDGSRRVTAGLSASARAEAIRG